MLKIDKEIFDRNLLLTQIYCEMQLANTDKPVAEILRSFNPEYNDRKLFSYRFREYKQVIWATDDPWSNGVYDQLFEDQMLHKENTLGLIAEGAQFKGQILVAEVDAAIPDGASESVSEAFIDGNDCPPIDTWFYKTRNNIGRVFYAWIPGQFVGLVQDAIDVNALECFTWEGDFMQKKEEDTLKHSKHQTKYIAPIENKKSVFKILTLIILITLICYLVQRFLS